VVSCPVALKVSVAGTQQSRISIALRYVRPKVVLKRVLVKAETQ